MTSLADKMRKQLKAGKKPKEIAAMFGTSETYVRAVRQRTTVEGFPRLTPADLAWAIQPAAVPALQGISPAKGEGVLLAPQGSKGEWRCLRFEGDEGTSPCALAPRAPRGPGTI